MTNEQTAIMLSNISRRVEVGIEKVKASAEFAGKELDCLADLIRLVNDLYNDRDTLTYKK